jgi:hypothetical protein
LSVGQGTGTWSRLSFALGVTGTLALGNRVGLTLGLSATAGVLQLSGAGYATSNHLTDWDAGLLARTLLFLPGLRGIRPYLGLDGTLWLRRHLVQDKGPPGGERLLPSLEASPCVGLSWTL